MKKNPISVEELLRLIPEDILDNLSEETEVDYQVKKLKGKVIFKLFLYTLASRKDLSWRIFEEITNQYKFKKYAGLSTDFKTDHSSLATRISKINVDFFKRIHESLNKEILERFEVKKIGGYRLVRFDSTMVSIAGTLLKKVSGLSHGVNNKNKKKGDPIDIKFTIGFDGLSPVVANFFGEQTYLSEEIALKEVIEEYAFGANDLAVFDRGLNKRKTLDNFVDNDLMFVTRMRTYRGGVKHKYVRDITDINIDKPIETKKLIIEKDQEVYLYGGKNSKQSKHTFRLIEARKKEDGKAIFFLTNEMDLTVEEVLLIYKYRWDIEVFFKFLKQEFGFSHLLSRSQNGIEAVLYLTLICFTLIYLYYKFNEMQSFKIAKMQFINELDFEVLKLVVELCNGDPNLLHLLNPF